MTTTVHEFLIAMHSAHDDVAHARYTFPLINTLARNADNSPVEDWHDWEVTSNVGVSIIREACVVLDTLIAIGRRSGEPGVPSLADMHAAWDRWHETCNVWAYG